RVLVESFVIQPEERAIPAVMEFYERAELGGQIDNWWGPSPECLLAMCRAAGFAEAELRDVTSQRASVLCRRRWAAPAQVSGAAPHLNSAINNRTYTAWFHPLKDEYLCCYFKSAASGLLPDDLQIEVDGLGVPTLAVTPNGADGWQASCARPAGLEAGRHGVTLRVRASPLSNAVEFVMLDEAGKGTLEPPGELPSDAPELCSAEYHPSGDLRLAASRGGSLICYFRSSAATIGVSDVAVEANAVLLIPSTISSLAGGVWQVNLLLTEALGTQTTVRIRLGSNPWSQSVRIVPAY
ncbi:MAG: hypothetical protein M3N54_15730, partial [Acidobacteriota bacterium]|nr:hypothetical protein [Acidobacteriota bacterium]